MIKFSEYEQRKLFIQEFNHIEKDLYCEVPVFCRSIDLVMHNKKDQTVSAIEFKTTNWKKAIKQVLEVSISFDYLEVCIVEPKTEKTKNQIMETCSTFGIGLYFFNQDTISFSYTVKSQKVNDRWELQKRQLVNILGEGDKNVRQSIKNTPIQYGK